MKSASTTAIPAIRAYFGIGSKKKTIDIHFNLIIIPIGGGSGGKRATEENLTNL